MRINAIAFFIHIYIIMLSWNCTPGFSWGSVLELEADALILNYQDLVWWADIIYEELSNLLLEQLIDLSYCLLSTSHSSWIYSGAFIWMMTSAAVDFSGKSLPYLMLSKSYNVFFIVYIYIYILNFYVLVYERACVQFLFFWTAFLASAWEKCLWLVFDGECIVWLSSLYFYC